MFIKILLRTISCLQDVWKYQKLKLWRYQLEIEVSTSSILLEGGMGTADDGFPNGVIDALTYSTIIGTRWLVSADIIFFTNTSIFVVDVDW